MELNITATIDTEWSVIDTPIKLYDVCLIASLKQEYLCGYIVPYEQFEYLYLGSIDDEGKLFAVQTKKDGKTYAKVLTKESDKTFALRIFKKARQNESQS